VAGWLAGQVARWLAGWLAGQVAGWLFNGHRPIKLLLGTVVELSQCLIMFDGT